MARIKSEPASHEREAFASRLAALRKTYGSTIGQPMLTMGEFAAMLGIEGERYRRYERGETEPPLWVLSTIRRVTGMSLNALIAGEIDRAA